MAFQARLLPIAALLSPQNLLLLYYFYASGAILLSRSTYKTGGPTKRPNSTLGAHLMQALFTRISSWIAAIIYKFLMKKTSKNAVTVYYTLVGARVLEGGNNSGRNIFQPQPYLPSPFFQQSRSKGRISCVSKPTCRSNLSRGRGSRFVKCKWGLSPCRKLVNLLAYLEL